MVDVLYEDNHLLAVDKPHGLLTQPSGTQEDSLEDQLKEWIKIRDHKPRGVFLHAVHRLDRPASGIVLFAKTQKGLSRLQQAFREKSVIKIYQAKVVHKSLANEGTLIHNLVHLDRKAAVDDHHPQGKKSILRYRKIWETEQVDCVEIELLTGRFHQIRAQLAAAGAPIIGDHKYGSHQPYPNGIALRHIKMAFPHPTRLIQISIDCAGWNQ